MKIFLIIYSLVFSSVSFAADTPNICTHDNPPHVYIYPADSSGDTKLVFKTPDFVTSKPEHVQSFKVSDKDGSLSLLLSCYYLQDPVNNLQKLNPTLVQLLNKRLAYWQTQLALTKDSDQQTLIQTSIDMMKSELKKTSMTTTDDCPIIVRDIVGPMTDYDKTTTYKNSTFTNGQFTSQPAKKLADILPAEFFQTISSTSTAGVYDFKNAGKGNCVPIPVLSGAQGPNSAANAAPDFGGQ